MTLTDWLLQITSSIAGFLWGLPMVVLLFGTGLLLTFMTGFVQVRNFGKATQLLIQGAFAREKSSTEASEDGDISPFQALMTALSATVGNGNIAGVATAIATGGPGAAFWMWVTAVFGMATKYAEAVLALHFRLRMPDGTMAGGPMYYCKYGIKNKRLGTFLGGFFAICGGVTALFGTGNMFQSQQIALAAQHQFGLEPWIMGIALSLMVGAVILGGIKRIGAVAEKLVPSMIIFYFAGALLVILANITAVPAAIGLIFTSAFSPQAAFGGAVGISVREAIRFGVARGVLSNESGLGSAAIAHGAARTRFPVMQGSIAMMGTFIDTIIVCSLTAITITVSGAYRESIFMKGPDGLGDSNLTVYAFNIGMPSFMGDWGGTIVVFGSLVFGFTTLIGWSYYGQICMEYLFGIAIVRPYRILFVILIFAGTLFTGPSAPIVKNLGDICNASMAFPNLIALILLSGIVAKVTRDSYRENSLEVHPVTPIEVDGH